MQYLLLIASALVFPILFWLHTSRVDDLIQNMPSGQTLPFYKKIMSLWTYLMITVLACLLIGLWYFNKPPEEPSFTFFKTADYQAEITNLRKSIQNITDDEVSDIVRIFRHVERIIEMENYEEAEVVLQNLDQGSDETGSFLKVDSYVVNNNLGILSFHIRRNKKFIASDKLRKAINMPNVPEPHQKRIRANIDKLDTSVNNID